MPLPSSIWNWMTPSYEAPILRQTPPQCHSASLLHLHLLFHLSGHEMILKASEKNYSTLSFCQFFLFIYYYYYFIWLHLICVIFFITFCCMQRLLGFPAVNQNFFLLGFRWWAFNESASKHKITDYIFFLDYVFFFVWIWLKWIRLDSRVFFGQSKCDGITWAS